MRHLINDEGSNPEDVISLTSTSSQTAVTDPVMLRDPTSTTRLYFKPLFVKNSKDPSKGVEGKIVYERKGKKDESFPTDIGTELLSKKSIHKGDTLELSLNSSETKSLYLGLRKLYALAGSLKYMPNGNVSFIEMNDTAQKLLSMLKSNPSVARMLVAEPDGFELIEELFRLLTQGTSRDKLRQVLDGLESPNLQELSSGINLVQLKSASAVLRDNLSNSHEEFWQSEVFSKYPWIISQVFSSPCVLFGEKAYVGGKAIDNQSGNVVDFIYQNQMTKNVALVEIKTPCTPILGNQYRQQVRSLSREMSGAINQVLNYKQSLLRDYGNLVTASTKDFLAFNPPCVVIIGNTSEFNADGVRDQAAFSTFENFRNCLNGVTIVTYDELLEKIYSLLGLLQTDANTPESDQVPLLELND